MHGDASVFTILGILELELILFFFPKESERELFGCLKLPILAVLMTAELIPPNF
jgi:hypothetical protein